MVLVDWGYEFFNADVKCGHVGHINAKGDALYIFSYVSIAWVCQDKLFLGLKFHTD